MANLITYTTDCPECKKKDPNTESKLSLNLDTGKIVCAVDPLHEFEEMPGEAAPIVTDVKPDETNKLGPAKAEDAVVNSDFNMEDRMAEITAKVRAESVPKVANNAPLLVVKPEPGPVRITGDPSAPLDVTVGLGNVIVLPGGDALCGIRVSEAWVSAMQAIGEESRPVRSVADVLQEYVDQGLLDWFVAPLQTK